MKKFNLIVSLIIVLILGCSLSPEGQSSLVVRIIKKGAGKTILPQRDLEIVSYSLNGSGPGGSTFSAAAGSTITELTSLEPGEWNITCRGAAANGSVIAHGEAAVTVARGGRGECSINLFPLDGNGSLELTALWNTGYVKSPELSLSLTDSGGGIVTPGITYSGEGAVIRHDALPAGYYTLGISLKDGNVTVGGAVEIIKIYAGITTSGSVTLTCDDPRGDLGFSFNYIEDLPLDLSIKGLKKPLFQGDTVHFSLDSDENITFETTKWHIDGEEKSSGVTFDLVLAEGKHNYRVDALGSSGGRYGSVSLVFQALEKQYFGSLLYVTRWFDSDPGYDGFNNIRDIRVTPDGKELIAAAYEDNALTVYSIDEKNGYLTYKWSTKGDNRVLLEGADDIALSVGGDYIAVCGIKDKALNIFLRDPGAGNISLMAVLYDEGNQTVLGTPLSSVFSPDSRYLYTVTSQNEIKIFYINKGENSIEIVDTIDNSTFVGADISGGELFLSPGGDIFLSAYDGDSLVHFSRDNSTGLLAYKNHFTDGIDGIDGLNGASSVVFYGDDIYVTGYYDSSLSWFKQDPLTGDLTYRGSWKNGNGTITGLKYPTDVEISADGSELWICASGDDSLVIFSRLPTGEVAFTTSVADETGVIDCLNGARCITKSPGGNVYLGASVDDGISLFFPAL